METVYYFLHNIFAISPFLFNTFRILNVDARYKDEFYGTVKNFRGGMC